MKKLRILGFAWLLALTMVGCGNAESKEQLSSEEQELADKMNEPTIEKYVRVVSRLNLSKFFVNMKMLGLQSLR